MELRFYEKEAAHTHKKTVAAKISYVTKEYLINCTVLVRRVCIFDLLDM